MIYYANEGDVVIIKPIKFSGAQGILVLKSIPMVLFQVEKKLTFENINYIMQRRIKYLKTSNKNTTSHPRTPIKSDNSTPPRQEAN